MIMKCCQPHESFIYNYVRDPSSQFRGRQKMLQTCQYPVTFFPVVRERDSFFILVKVTKTFRHVTFAIITLATQTVYHFLEEKASTRLKLLTFEFVQIPDILYIILDTFSEVL